MDQGGDKMKKYRINTTISIQHRDLLKKLVEKYGTQQSALEHSLESLENSSHLNKELSEQEEIWLRLYREINGIITILPKEIAKILIETVDIEEFKQYIQNVKQVESVLEYNYKKHLNEFSLPELIHGIITNIKIQGSSDFIHCTEKEDHYIIYLTHRLGINHSKLLVIMNRSVFNNYGVEYEANCSKRSVFFKVYK